MAIMRMRDLFPPLLLSPPAGRPATDKLTLVLTAAHQPRRACSVWHAIDGRWGPASHCVSCVMSHPQNCYWRLSHPTVDTHCPVCGEEMT